MSEFATDKPFVLSIAGFDPSAGAGILADIKTCEQLDSYGLGVITANTFQTHQVFDKIDWLPEESILEQTELMLKTYPVKAIKMGLLPDFSLLREIRNLAMKFGAPVLILDPVCKSSSGFGFHQQLNSSLLSSLDLITPNWEEAKTLGSGADAQEIARHWSSYTDVLLKGGHSGEDSATDYLFQQQEVKELSGRRFSDTSKHGSGCVLSAAIACYLAQGEDMVTACQKAKAYVLGFLQSNHGSLGYHKPIDYAH